MTVSFRGRCKTSPIPAASLLAAFSLSSTSLPEAEPVLTVGASCSPRLLLTTGTFNVSAELEEPNLDA